VSIRLIQRLILAKTVIPNKRTFSDLAQKAVQDIAEVANSGSWIGRVKTSGGQFRVVSIEHGELRDLTSVGIWSTASLLQHQHPLEVQRELASKAPIMDTSLVTALKNSIEALDQATTHAKGTHFVSPHDLSAVKAAGVVFVRSLLERVIEEKTKGDSLKAQTIRNEISNSIGTQMSDVVPGSPSALRLLHLLTKEKGFSHHYLEVGLGVDAEIFTKSQPMSSIGFGAQLGIHPKSSWNNPEPELIVVTNRFGQIVGCCLGNDVNLRDFEGRSALLLGKAKDNNGSCVVGPLIRLFDDTFSLITSVMQTSTWQSMGRTNLC